MWTVETLSRVVDTELEALPVSIRARLARVIDLIERHGLEHVREPHVKHLEGKLWEIRASAREGEGRAIYVTASGRRVVIVHAFAKKQQRTPKQAVALARQRAKEVV